MYGFDTRAAHGGQADLKEKTLPSVVLAAPNREDSESENSTRSRLEECIASLECGKFAVCFSSGIAAVTSITQLLDDGDHVVIFDSVYHGTRTYLTVRESLNQLQVTFADLRNHRDLEKHLRPNTRMVWIETPCNPTMKIVDIQEVSKIVKRHGKAFLVVDNTFMSSYFQNPLLLGADIVMHSITKYMNGHSDVLMGAAATNSEKIAKALKETSKSIGSYPGPLDCYLVLRGLQTLHLRMERHAESAMAVALFLEAHPKVEAVFYPGLASHPQHETAKKQSRGFGGMVSFQVRGEVREFAKTIRLLTLAVSLGSVESLVDIPSLMTASALSPEEKEELGVTDNLVRLSVGLEAASDIIADLDRALNAC